MWSYVRHQKLQSRHFRQYFRNPYFPTVLIGVCWVSMVRCADFSICWPYLCHHQIDTDNLNISPVFSTVGTSNKFSNGQVDLLSFMKSIFTQINQEPSARDPKKWGTCDSELMVYNSNPNQHVRYIDGQWRIIRMDHVQFQLHLM